MQFERKVNPGSMKLEVIQSDEIYTTHTSVDSFGGVTFNPLHHHPTLPPDVEFDSEEELSEEYYAIKLSSARGGSINGARSVAPFERQICSDHPLTTHRPSRRSLSAPAAHRAPSPTLATLPTFAAPASEGEFDGPGFDLDWSTMQAGITGLDMDDVAVQRPRQLSLMMQRRQSTASGGSMMSDPDTFLAAVRKWEGEKYDRQRKHWTFRRDAADGRGGGASASARTRQAGLSLLRNITGGRIGGGTSMSNGIGRGNSGHGAGKRPKHAPWRGMALNAEEIWNCSLVGSFKVRRIELRPQKTQQRVTIDPFRGPFTLGPKPPHDGAYTNIHKHSKVTAFSIHRHYKPTRPPPDVFAMEVGGSGRGSVSNGSGGGFLSGNGHRERQRPAAVILLAPRHVQEAYRSTNTTKGLAYGLVDGGNGEEREDEGDGTRSAGRREERRIRENEREARQNRDFIGPRPDAMRQRRSRNSLGLVDELSTVDASDQMVLAQGARYDEGSNDVLSGVPQRPAGPAHPKGPVAPHQVYSAPQSRVKQEERRRKHDMLTNVFEDVGLLPPKKSTGGERGAKKAPLTGVDIFAQVPADALFMLLPLWPGSTDPVSERNATRAPHEIPMEQRQYLLVSYKPREERALPPGKNSKHDDGGRGSKGSRGSRGSRGSTHSSSTSSADNSARRGCEILLTPYHINARLVSHADLQGSGVRVPDEGLAVLGPWHEALLSMPQLATRRGDHDLLVIGTCTSRDAGVEFDPEGLVKLGLCIPVPPDADEDEDEMQEEPVAELTPIGKAVLEMAWIGSIAATSFGPAGSS
ncbi:hypothetical protein B0H19DRAFT_668020 [Mycena capillaripes]|nr:hypothetical protein B0H19DRAFT_668020 [Mycena capillaripes]